MQRQKGNVLVSVVSSRFRLAQSLPREREGCEGALRQLEGHLPQPEMRLAPASAATAPAQIAVYLSVEAAAMPAAAVASCRGKRRCVGCKARRDAVH